MERGKRRVISLLLVCVIGCFIAGCGTRNTREENYSEGNTDPEEWYLESEQQIEGRLFSGTKENTSEQNGAELDVQDNPASEQGEQVPKTVEEIPERKDYSVTFQTYFSTANTGRAHNIELAAELLDGWVLSPGEVISCSKAIGPITAERGYEPAGIYMAGKVEEGIGGGVCQISTTLYNAALLAGLTIVERAPHSMIVNYVSPARDAAIAGDYKDLKLRNDFASDVTIYASAKDGVLIFTICTGEEDLGETVELESNILSEIAPPAPVETVDETKPEGYRAVTQKAHTGYVAELYRVIRKDGMEMSRTLVNTSVYQATPEYVTVGAQSAEQPK